MWGRRRHCKPGPSWALRMEGRIMAKLEEYVQSVNAAFDTVQTGIDGITTDLSALDAKVEELKAANGQLTPDQEAALQGLVDRAEAIKNKVSDLDGARPAVEPPANPDQPTA